MAVSFVAGRSYGELLQVSEAGLLAKFLVTGSMLFPAYRETAMAYDLLIANEDDPTVMGARPEQEAYILQLMRAAHDKAKRLVLERRSAIERVAKEICESSDDTISGTRIVQIIESAPMQQEPKEDASVRFSDNLIRPGQYHPFHTFHAWGEEGCSIVREGS